MSTNKDSEIAEFKQLIQDQKERCEFFNDAVKKSEYLLQDTKSYYLDKRLFCSIQNLMPEEIWDRDWFVAHASNETFPDEHCVDEAESNMDRNINIAVMDEANKAAAEAKLVVLEATLEVLEAAYGSKDVSDMEAKLPVLEAKLMELEAVAAARRAENVVITGDDEASNYDIRFDFWRQDRMSPTEREAYNEARSRRWNIMERAPDDDEAIVAAQAARMAAWNAARAAVEVAPAVDAMSSRAILQPEPRPANTRRGLSRVPQLLSRNRRSGGGMATRKKNRRYKKKKTKYHRRKTKRYTKKRNMRY